MVNISRLLYGIIFMAVFLAVRPGFAEITVVDSLDINRAMALIAARSPAADLNKAAVFTIKDKEVSFASWGNSNVLTTFRISAPTVEKHIKLENGNNQYNFKAVLLSQMKFQNVTRDAPWGQALIFDDGIDILIYTQSSDNEGNVYLKEWIYARKPNSKTGSRYRWHFKPQIWDWPLTVELDKDRNIGLYRNMPVFGVPMTDIKRRTHVADVVHRVMTDNIKDAKFYFPFHDKIADMAAPVAWTREGREFAADISITDEPMKFQESKKKAKGPDWSHLYSKQQNVFEVNVKAKPDEYPLLIDPTLEF